MGGLAGVYVEGDSKYLVEGQHGSPPQHTGYRGEETELQIGANCVIREQTSIHRGTPVGGGRTVIGDNSNIMAAAHIGHDVQIGKNVIVASN